MLREAEQRATTAITRHRMDLHRRAGLLLERETIDGTEIDSFLGLQPAPHFPP